MIHVPFPTHLPLLLWTLKLCWSRGSSSCYFFPKRPKGRWKETVNLFLPVPVTRAGSSPARLPAQPGEVREGRCYRSIKSHCFRKKSRHLGSLCCLSSQTELEILQSPEPNHHGKHSGTAHEMLEPGEPPNLGSTVWRGLRNRLHSASVLAESSFTRSLKAHLLQHGMLVTRNTARQDQAAAACPGRTLAPPLQQTLLLPLSALQNSIQPTSHQNPVRH